MLADGTCNTHRHLHCINRDYYVDVHTSVVRHFSASGVTGMIEARLLKVGHDVTEIAGHASKKFKRATLLASNHNWGST